MQNYEQILQELGIEVPDEKKADLKKKMGENYRTKSDYDKAVDKRDEYKQSLDDVQTKLNGFKDVDVDDLKGQISALTTQLADEKAARAADARKVELDKDVTTLFSALDEKGEKKYEFLNDITADHYRSALLEELEKDSAKGKSIEDIFKSLITDKDGNQKTGIFADREQQKAQQNAAKFTTAFKGSGTGGAMTKADFKALSLDERIKLKQEQPELYESLK